MSGTIAPYGNCPVQAEGQLEDGKWYYFRSRGDAWRFQVGTSESDAVENCDIFVVGGEYGVWPEAGWMPDEQASEIIRLCIETYNASRPRLSWENKE